MSTTTNTRKPRVSKATAPKEEAAPKVEDTPTTEDPTPTEETPKRKTIRAEAYFGKAFDLVKAAGEDGIKVADVAKGLGLTYRQTHNVLWRMEGAPQNGVLKHEDQRTVTRTGEGASAIYKPRKAGDSVNMKGKYATKGGE